MQTNYRTSSELSFAPETVSFNEIVCQAIDRTLEDLLGSKVVEVVYRYLKANFGVDRNELPYRIDTVCLVLRTVFGVKAAHTIERKVARNLFDKILLPFNDEEGATLEEFLKIAKETVSRDNHYV
jgi:hypothetical protein